MSIEDKYEFKPLLTKHIKDVHFLSDQDKYSSYITGLALDLVIDKETDKKAFQTEAAFDNLPALEGLEITNRLVEMINEVDSEFEKAKKK